MRSRTANLPLPLQSHCPWKAWQAQRGRGCQGDLFSAACSRANPLGHAGRLDSSSSKAFQGWFEKLGQSFCKTPPASRNCAHGPSKTALACEQSAKDRWFRISPGTSTWCQHWVHPELRDVLKSLPGPSCVSALCTAPGVVCRDAQ